MSPLFSPAPRREPLLRRCTTMAASAMLHAAAVAVLFSLARATGLVDVEAPPRDLTFIDVLPPPVRSPLHVPPVVKEQVTLIEVPPAEPPPPPPEPERPRDEPAPAPEPARERPVAAERPRPAPPAVTVGAFASAGATARTPEPSRAVQVSGFDAPTARTPAAKMLSAAVGVFEASERGRTRPGTERPDVVGDAGFGAGVATGRARGAGGVVADGGFGAGAVSGPARAPGRAVAAGGFDTGSGGGAGTGQPAPAVKVADFDARAAQPSARQAPRQARSEVPLESCRSRPRPIATKRAP